jgi:hypothetical protein
VPNLLAKLLAVLKGWPWWVWAALLAVLLIVGQCAYIQTLRGQLADQTIQTLNAAAERDSTRLLGEKARALLGDSLSGYQKLILQAHLERDALDKALHQERVVTGQLRATIRELATTTTTSGGVTLNPTDTTQRVGHFTVRDPPYTVEATATLPPPPTPGSLALRVALDPLRVTARVGCGPQSNGARPATLTVLGPTWAAITLDSLQADPAVCSYHATQAGKGRPWWVAPVALAGAVLVGHFIWQ